MRAVIRRYPHIHGHWNDIHHKISLYASQQIEQVAFFPVIGRLEPHFEIGDVLRGVLDG